MKEEAIMAERIMSCLAKETGGTSHKAFKYGLDHADKPTVDYDGNGII